MEETPLSAPQVDHHRTQSMLVFFFADVTNIGSLSGGIGQSPDYDAVRAVLEQLAQPVVGLGGQISGFSGDGLAAIFDTPDTGPDGVQRAIRAALEMQRIMKEIGVELGGDVQLRIGLDAGVENPPEISPTLEPGTSGQHGDLASRLQSAARPGTILVSDSIFRQGRTGFVFSEALPLNLAGAEKPVLGYEVLGQRLAATPGRGLTNHSTPLVGRLAETDAIITALQRLQLNRQGLSLLITGEAGIGKTRLVAEVLAPAAENLLVVQTECSPHETGSYSLLKSILAALVGIVPDQSLAERRERLTESLGRSAVLAREIEPIISDILDINESPKAPTVDPQQEQRRLFGATRRLMAWMARRQPLALVMDDLQWADTSSLEAISHFSDLVVDAPLVLVAIARPSAREQLISILKQNDQEPGRTFVEFELTALPPDESEQLLNLMLPDVPVPAALQQSLLERGAGNPLLLEEITRRLLDQEVIYQTEAGWKVRFDWAEALGQAPVTVNGLVLSRYDRLPNYLQQVLDVAAVFKRQFSLVELAAMTEIKDTVLAEWVRDLEQADIFRPIADTRRPRYGFRHPLLREAIYQTIPRSQRQALHLRVANVIQLLASGDSLDTVELVAFHLEQGRSPLALAYLRQAAGRAADRYANQEAIDYYRRLQNLADEDAQLSVDVALGLGELMVRINQPEAARDELGRALQLALAPELHQYRLGDIWYRLAVIQADRGNQTEAGKAFANAASMLASAPETCGTFTLTDIEREQGWNLCNQAQYAEAQVHAARALTEALVRSDQRAVAAAHNLRSVITFYLGQLQESVASATQALAIREQLNDVWGSASTQTNLGTLYYKLGQWTTAESYLRQAIFVQQEIGDRYTLGLSRNTLSLLLLASGRLDEALQLLDQALTYYTSASEPSPLVCLLLMNRGLAHSRLGHGQQALTDLEQSLALSVALNSDNLKILDLAYLAEAYLALGDMQRAHERLKEADTLEQAAPSPGNRAEIARISSEVHQAEGAWAMALANNRQAAILYKELGETHEYARSQAAWAGIELNWQALEPGHALAPACQAALLEAADIFRTLRAQADIVSTEALLARLIAVLGSPESGSQEAARPFVVAAVLQLSALAQTAANSNDAEGPVIAVQEDRLAALKRKGQEFGAVTTSNARAATFVFSASDPAEADILILRAVQCVAEARDGAARLNLSNKLMPQPEFGLRIGLSASLLRSSDTSGKRGITATTIAELESRANALASEAPINQIYLGQELVAAVGLLYNLETIASLEDLRPTTTHYRLGQARSNNAQAHKLPGSSDKVMGRAMELAALRSWIDKSLQMQEGQVCYIEAEAGMGKTRLQAEAIAYAAPHMTCLTGKCELHRSSISFWAFSNMLESLQLTETPASRRLKTILGLQPPQPEDELMLRNLGPVNLRQELFGRLREFLMEATTRGPLLLVIEDIHWLDLSSLDLLDFLLPVIREAPISILLTARAEMAGPHRSLLSKAERICGDRYLQIRFSGLAEEDSLAMVRQMLDVPILPRGLARMLRAYAGHPLSLEEAVRLLIESGHLRRADNRWLLTETGGVTGKELPDTYEDLLLARLEGLDGEALHVLQAAATLGENVDQALLSAVVPGPSVGAALSQLVDRGWLLPPETTSPLLYRFKHTLTRETIHATLLTSKNRILHQRAGEAIESLYPDSLDARVEVLAYHFGHSSQRDKAVNYLVQAGEKSAARQALAESLAFYQEAAEAIKNNPILQGQLGVRLRLGLADVYLALGIPASAMTVVTDLLADSTKPLTAEVEGAVRQRQASALRKIGQLREALASFELARDVLQKAIAEGGSLAASAKNTITRDLLVAKFGVVQTLFDMRENGQASQNLQQFLSDVDRDQFPDLAAQALDLQGGLAYRLQQAETALQVVHESLAIYQSIGNRAGAAAAYANLGILSASFNRLDEAADYFAHSRALREALGDAQGLAIIQNNLGQLLVREGRFAEAVSEFAAAGQYARRAGLRQLLGQSLSNHGYVLTLQGDTSRALPILYEAEKLCESYGFRNLLCETIWKLAECHLEGNDLVAAEAAARTALGQALDLASNDLQSETRRVLSRIARKTDRPTVALAEAETAWTLRQKDGNPSLRSRFVAEYGLALSASGQREHAEAFLRENLSASFAYVSASNMLEIRELLRPVQSN